jgi:ABC-type Fe3+ transport system permease subunit
MESLLRAGFAGSFILATVAVLYGVYLVLTDVVGGRLGDIEDYAAQALPFVAAGVGLCIAFRLAEGWAVRRREARERAAKAAARKGKYF